MSAQPRLRFLTRATGARIAYTVWGDGSALVRPPGWISHQGHSLGDDRTVAFAAALSSLRPPWRLIAYDKQGNGLSDRNREDFSFEGLVTELEEVVDQLGLDRFALYGGSGGGPISIAYAARHPERVSRVILSNTHARGATAITPQLRDAIAALIEAEWLIGSETLGQIFSPDATADEQRAFARFQRETASPAIAGAIWQTFLRADVSALVPAVTAPCLVLHNRGDRVIAFDAGVELAATLPNARLMPIESADHNTVLTHGRSAALDVIRAFLAEEPAPGAIAPALIDVGASVAPHPPLTVRQLQVLRFIAAGRSSREIAAELVLSERTVQRHISELYAKIDVRNRAEATAFALRLLRA